MGESSAIAKKGTLPIEVNKDVVKHLSIGLYRNFALAIREIISNSYDAGATEVKIKLDLKNKKIIIRDNGKGMDFDEFKKQYLRIGFGKEPAKSPDELGRMRIGTFGIGFLAPLPYCKVMRVITKKKGGHEVIQASINAENFFREGTWDISEEKVPYEISKSDLPKAVGETIIVLEDIQPQIYRDLQRTGSLGKSKLDQLGGFDKFKWTLCQYAPIPFPPNRKDLIEFLEEPKRVPMRIWLDGEELFRNVPADIKILEKDAKIFGNVSVKYVIMSSYEPIKPEEARGLQLRLRDVAIGFPTTFDVTKLGRVLGKLNFICGEVHVTKGLDSALMVSRDSFNYTEEVAEIYEFFRSKLTEWNEVLYRQAEEDKRIYDALGPVKDNEEVVSALRKAEIVHFAKERLRLQEDSITKVKKTKAEKPLKKLIEVLSESKRGHYKVISKKGKVSRHESPIKVQHKEKSIVVYEDHPVFVETISIGEKKFNVGYEEWNPDKTPYSICKLVDRESKVLFNTVHPLFKSKLSDQIIKKISLGIVLILKDRKDGEQVIEKLNHLLEDTFLG